MYVGKIDLAGKIRQFELTPAALLLIETWERNAACLRAPVHGHDFRPEKSQCNQGVAGHGDCNVLSWVPAVLE